MDDIATAADCSRASIYFHFGTKEEVFRVLSADLHEQWLSAMTAAAKAPHPDVAARLLAMLDARFTGFVELTHDSPHGAEIVEQGNRSSTDVLADAQARTLALLVGTLRAAARSGELDLKAAGLSATAAAQVLIDGAHGAKAHPGVAPAAYRRRLAAIIRLLVRGMRPG